MKYLLMMLPMMLIQLGGYLKNKDKDNVGTDDAFANVLIAVAPAIDAYANSNENALKKALRAVRTTIDNYLGDE